MQVLRLAGAALAVAIVSGAGAACAGGGTPEAGSPLALPLDGGTTAPDWLRTPSGEDLEREYPPLAQYLKLSGGAQISCAVQTDGRLDDCHVLSEWPVGVGFGTAAVRSTAYMMMKPATLDGKPVVGRVVIPLKFRLAGESAEPLKPAAAPPPTSAAALTAARKVILLQDVAGHLRAAWSVAFDRLAAQAVFNGQAQSSTAALDAFRQGLDEAVAPQVDLQARLLASKMTETDLRATAAYLQTPAGKAWIVADASASQASGKDTMDVLARAARKHLCAQSNCDGPDAKPTKDQSASR